MRVSNETLDQFTTRMAVVRSRLLKLEPMISFLSLELPTYIIAEEDAKKQGILTACTNGSWYKYNFEWCRQLTDKELMFVIAHETAHVMFMHAIRRNARDPYRWNAACDYVINWLLAEGKLKGHAAMPMSDETLDQIEAEQTGAPVKKTKAGQMKPVGLIDKKYANMTAEQVYDRLPETKYIVWDMMQDPGKDGNSKGSDATDQAQAKARIALGKALARAKEYRKNTQRGTEPGDWERIAEEGMEPTVSWQNQLQSATTCTGQDTHTWARPNRKYRAQGYYLPSYRGFQLPKTLFVFDTSGSIDNTFLGQMAAELNKLLCTAPRSTITVATCDTEIHVLGEFSAGTPFIPSKHPLPGGGGTDFRAPFEFALKHRYEQIIYLTDTYGTFPEKERLRTIWLVPVECTENIPFGEVITIPMLTEKE